MLIQVAKDELLIGERVHASGEVIEVADDVAKRHLKAKSAVIPVGFAAPVETATLTAPESADRSPNRGRRS